MPMPLARSSMVHRTGIDSPFKKHEELISPNKFEAAEGNSWVEPTSPNLSMRRRASSLIQSLPSSAGFVKVPFSAETSIDSYGSHNASRDHHSARPISHTNQLGKFSCDRILADMESNLTITQRKLEEEKIRNELLTEKIQLLRKTCEQTERQKDEASEKLNELTLAVRRYTDKDLPLLSVTQDSEAGILRDVLASNIEGTETDLYCEEERPAGEARSYNAESISTVLEPSDTSNNSSSNATLTNSIEDPRKSKIDIFVPKQQLTLQEHLSSRKSIQGSSTTSLNSLSTGIKRKSLDQDVKAHKSPRNSAIPTGLLPVASSECKAGRTATAEAGRYPLRPVATDERFSYVEGYDVKCAEAPRPISVAQANRHSAIIGDQLFSLQAIPPPLEEENNLSDRTSLAPFTPQSAMSFFGKSTDQEPSFALSTHSGYEVTTSAPPSEDNPAISCRVNRTFEDPLGGGYIKRRFEKKLLRGRTSVSAYRRQQVG